MTRRRTRSANCAFSEMEHVGSFYICSICKILLLPSASDGSRDPRGGSGDEWLGQPPTHLAPSPIPLGALRDGDGVGRWAGRMGARLPTEWVVLCGGVDLRAFTEGLGANFEQRNSCVTAPFPVSLACHLRASLCHQSVEPRGTMLSVQSESGIIYDERQRNLTHRAA